MVFEIDLMLLEIEVVLRLIHLRLALGCLHDLRLYFLTEPRVVRKMNADHRPALSQSQCYFKEHMLRKPTPLNINVM